MKLTQYTERHNFMDLGKKNSNHEHTQRNEKHTPETHTSNRGTIHKYSKNKTRHTYSTYGEEKVRVLMLQHHNIILAEVATLTLCQSGIQYSWFTFRIHASYALMILDTCSVLQQ